MAANARDLGARLQQRAAPRSPTAPASYKDDPMFKNLEEAEKARSKRMAAPEKPSSKDPLMRSLENRIYEKKIANKEPRAAKAFGREFIKGAIETNEPTIATADKSAAFLAEKMGIPYKSPMEMLREAGIGAKPKSAEQLLTDLGIEKEEDLPVEKFAGRAGRLTERLLPAVALGPGGAAAAIGGATVAGHAAEEMGFGPTGQAIAETVGSLGAGLLSGARAAGEHNRLTIPRVVSRNINPRHAGEILEGRATNIFDRMNREASQIATRIGQSNREFSTASRAIPHANQINTLFNNQFEMLEHAARQVNMPLNPSIANNFLAQEVARYSNAGQPTAVGNFVLQQARQWEQTGQNNLFSMFRRYRMNNAQIEELRATMPYGRQRNEMIGFLTNWNRNIKNTFHANMGTQALQPYGQTAGAKINPWLQSFENTNRDYANWRSTQNIRRVLDPIIEGRASDAQMTRRLNNPAFWDDVARKLGPEESDRLRTLMQDMINIRQSINGMRRSDVGRHLWMKLLASKIPGLGTIVKLAHIPAAWRWMRGIYNTRPESGRNMSELAEALASRNFPAAQTAISNLQKESEEE